MKYSPVLLCSALMLRAAAQTFEPDSFNVTAALVAQGVNVTKLYETTGLQERDSAKACSLACKGLKAVLGDDVVETQDEAAYQSFTAGYWSKIQEDVQPYCIFKPASAAEVSVAVLVSRLSKCPFAVKSGGHAAFAGASNVEGGITVSLEKLNQIKLSTDKKTASIGPGNTWSTVYSTLQKSDVTVIGGRVSKIGVGGLTLGGGISFFSSIYGWACDNVDSYDVVTASGAIVTATTGKYPDLYWALRGGGNNFGIVVNFNMRTVPVPGGGAMWGGTRTFVEASFAGVINAFTGLVANSPKDPKAGQWMAFLQNQGLRLVATELWYTEPNGQKAEIFADYFKLTPVADTTQNRDLAGYTIELQDTNPYGLREVYYGLTIKADPALATIATNIFYEELPAVVNVEGSNPVLIFQGITTGQLNGMDKNGGNPLGLSAKDGPLYLIHIACWWNNAKDDAAIYKFSSKVLRRITDEAKKRGKQNDYLYMNYASQYEDVIASYGAGNKAKLKKIAGIYDPKKVFQELQPGYFKLDRAPVSGGGFFSGL